MTLLIRSLLISLSIITLTLSVSAGEADFSCDIVDFGCYEKLSRSCRTDTSLEWNRENIPGLGPSLTEPYVKLDQADQERAMQSLISKERIPTEQERLRTQLNVASLNGIAGLKAIEFSRIQMRTNMNRLFSCAVTTSRIQKIQQVSKLVKNTSSSDMMKKLESDVKKMEELRGGSCGSTTNTADFIALRKSLMKSTSQEYCSYLFYLEYINANISTNYQAVKDIDTKSRGVDAKAPINATIISVQNDFQTYIKQLQDAKTRVKLTLPKVLVAFREMDRTYAIHLMLLIIYDDYLELRQNISTYLNATSQLFEKAKNAQSANK